MMGTMGVAASGSGEDLITLARLLADPVAAEKRIKEFTESRAAMAADNAKLVAESARLTALKAELEEKAARLDAREKELDALENTLGKRAAVIENNEKAFAKDKAEYNAAMGKREVAVGDMEARVRTRLTEVEAAYEDAKENSVKAVALRRKLDNVVSTIKAQLGAD